MEQEDAERYAERHHMGFYEVSPLVNFNITESFQELCRMALRRNGMERLWRGRQVGGGSMSMEIKNALNIDPGDIFT